jgi:hypothetical protein
MNASSDEICIVGYALNKKKLRKGGTALPSSSSGTAVAQHKSSSSLSPSGSAVRKIDLQGESDDGEKRTSLPSPEQQQQQHPSQLQCLSTSTSKHDLSSPASPSVWKGGGLADLLTDKLDTRVRFQPVDFDSPLEEQPFFHVIIHKLTEDIRGQDIESKAKLKFLSDYLR